MISPSNQARDMLNSRCAVGHENLQTYARRCTAEACQSLASFGVKGTKVRLFYKEHCPPGGKLVPPHIGLPKIPNFVITNFELCWWDDWDALPSLLKVLYWKGKQKSFCRGLSVVSNINLFLQPHETMHQAGGVWPIRPEATLAIPLCRASKCR